MSERLDRFLSELARNRGRAAYRPESDNLEDLRSFQADFDQIEELQRGGLLKIIGKPHRESRTAHSFVDLVLIELTGKGVQMFSEPSAGQSRIMINQPASQDPRNVFVIHGRNSEARNSLFRFLRSIGLRPLEWSQAVRETGKGVPFIGDILDVAFSMARAVVVLLTPDDEARLREPFRSPGDPAYESQLTGQARPNVLFEAGMAMGRDPNRTIIVELGTVRPFSDIAGRHTVRLSNDSAARQELAQRLETAGCSVDLSGRDWHTEGDFNVTPVQPSAAPQSSISQSLAGTSWDFREVITKSSFGPVVVYSFSSDGHGRYVSAREKGDFSWKQEDDTVVIVREDRGEFILTRVRQNFMSGYFYPPIQGGFKLHWTASMRE